MTMERRRGTRKPIEVDVVIDNQPASLLRGRIDDISIGGLFVRTESEGLSMHAHVELVLLLQREGATRVYRLPAVVVRLAPHGAGLMFDQYDVNAFRTLVVLLLAHRHAAASGPDPRRRAAPKAFYIEDGIAASTKEGAAAPGHFTVRRAAPVSLPSPACGESH